MNPNTIVEVVLGFFIAIIFFYLRGNSERMEKIEDKLEDTDNLARKNEGKVDAIKESHDSQWNTVNKLREEIANVDKQVSTINQKMDTFIEYHKEATRSQNQSVDALTEAIKQLGQAS